MFDSSGENEIQALMTVIEAAIFANPKSDDPQLKSFDSSDKFYDLRDIKTIQDEMDFAGLNKSSFIRELAEETWHFKNSEKEMKQFLKDLQRGHNTEIENFLGQFYYKKDIKRAMAPLKKARNKRIESFLKTDDYHYFTPGTSKISKKPWKFREDEFIENVRKIYCKYLPMMSNRQIQTNMAFLFVGIDFWSDIGKDDKSICTCYERLRKRFYKINKSKSEEWEVFDPDDVKNND